MEEVSEQQSDQRNTFVVSRYVTIVRNIPNSASTVSINQQPPITNSDIGKVRAVKNLLVIGFSLFLYFMGFMALSNLQSSMNSDAGQGVNSLAAIYGVSMASAVLLPAVYIKSFGCKNTLIISILGSIPFLFMGAKPYKYGLISSAALLGGFAGPLTAAQSFYTNEMGRIFHRESPSESLEEVVARFFGIYSFFLANTQIWGNLISYFVLRHSVVPLQNATEENCGVDYSLINGTDPNLFPPTSGERTALLSIYISCAFLSIFLMLFFLDPLDNDVDPERKCIHRLKYFLCAVKQSWKLDQVLLIPISVYCGIEISFYTSDFTKAFIACSWGIYHVGFVTICLGASGAIMALLVGPLVKWITQTSVFLLAGLINVIVCTVLFVWRPSSDVTAPYFIIAGAWGMTDAIWWSQVPALYGLLFPNNREAAFSNFYFWAFFGYFISFMYANYITVAVKINVMLIFLVAGLAGYLAVHFRHACSPRREYVRIDGSEEE